MANELSGFFANRTGLPGNTGYTLVGQINLTAEKAVEWHKNGRLVGYKFPGATTPDGRPTFEYVRMTNALLNASPRPVTVDLYMYKFAEDFKDDKGKILRKAGDEVLRVTPVGTAFNKEDVVK